MTSGVGSIGRGATHTTVALLKRPRKALDHRSGLLVDLLAAHQIGDPACSPFEGHDAAP